MGGVSCIAVFSLITTANFMVDYLPRPPCSKCDLKDAVIAVEGGGGIVEEVNQPQSEVRGEDELPKLGVCVQIKRPRHRVKKPQTYISIRSG